MAKRTIRITGSGIYGNPTDENPTGEMPIGYEFETEADLPAGWVGRAVIVGDEPKEGSIFLTGDGDDSELAILKREGQRYIDRLTADHKTDLAAITSRAERAEADLQYANEQISTLNLKLAELDRDGNGPPGGDAATADEIRTAVDMLDSKTDAHWTKAGLPAVDAVAEITGKSVTREAIEAAAPDAKRPTA